MENESEEEAEESEEESADEHSSGKLMSGLESAEDEAETQTKEYYASIYQQNNRRGVKEPLDELVPAPPTSVEVDYKDLMKTIDWNEHKYQEQARLLIKTNQILTAAA
jgi:hypothetical protein